ncbi:MAG: phenylalanine--tRNA ligase subunit beta [Firmicutes bacterium]|nr:phenylalanine--tRNA ligase subunit beta [Bacillota bacterium]
MLVPVNWLKKYVDIDINTKELADELTMSGSHVDSIEETNKGVDKVVVGKILEINDHPNADKLVITKVDVGEEELKIVTGATNINKGDYVPIALVGAKLPGGMKIKKSKLRGESSFGMMCSLDELGISSDLIPKEFKNGILILDKEYELGKDIKDILELDEKVIDFEITPNRPDCLSIIGMARETAATLNKELKIPNVKINNQIEDIKDYVNGIEVLDNDLCKRYYSKVVKNIKVKPSPLWMQQRLIKAGVRPINNIVDVTNYVMLELGQPLHAFDLDKLKDKKIEIRRAKEDEEITTLDGVKRDIDDSMLIIADAEKPIAIAGVMGGENSEVSKETKTILIESANFDGRSVRLTSRRVGLRTEASSKFEKNLDPNLSEIACKRVCQLLEDIKAGEVIKGEIDIYDKLLNEKSLSLRPERVNKLLSTDLSKQQMIDILNRLEFKAEKVDKNIKVIVPTFRQDIELEADIIEEIGRIYGFSKIEPKPFKGTLTKGEKSRQRKIEDIVKNKLTGFGLNEIMTYSFISPKAYDRINLPEYSMKRKYVELLNPLGEDYSVMRTTLIPNMLDALARNYKYGVNKAWAYEIGNIFTPKNVPVKSLPYENKNLCIGMYGEVDFYYIKGILNTILESLGVYNVEYMPEKHHNTFHPGRTASVVKNNNVLATIGEIHPDVLKNYGIKERVYALELDLEITSILTNLKNKYKELPKYPAINRDMAIVLDEEILVKEIEKIIKETGGELIEDITLFDVYKGEQIPEGKKSVAYSVTYRSYERTLKDEEVSKIHKEIVELIKDKLQATLRS